MALLALFVFYEVVSRYLFNSPTIWANELSTYMLQFIVFLSMGYLLIQDEHIKVSFLVEKLSGIAKKIVQITATFLVIPYAYVLIVYGFQYTNNSLKMGRVSPTLLEFPLWVPYSFIAIGGVLLVISSICTIIKIILEDTTIFEKGEEV
ncbi:TRAP transporter small permease [Lentibacillus jeotgali]|uniref:TRAP transporter small permease n=1 Tax=Lentibacillus jeotgali TaxID=558169 RepID=UPI00158569BC|nr:TRAP transporter small permease [Lentibacillus jeotgali]